MYDDASIEISKTSMATKNGNMQRLLKMGSFMPYGNAGGLNMANEMNMGLPLQIVLNDPIDDGAYAGEKPDAVSLKPIKTCLRALEIHEWFKRKRAITRRMQPCRSFCL